MKEFKSINLRRPTWEGFRAMQACAYELTGAACYLNNKTYYEDSEKGHIYINLITSFWRLKNEIKGLVKEGATCKYSFSCMNCEKVPFIYNRLIF